MPQVLKVYNKFSEEFMWVPEDGFDPGRTEMGLKCGCLIYLLLDSVKKFLQSKSVTWALPDLLEVPLP